MPSQLCLKYYSNPVTAGLLPQTADWCCCTGPIPLQTLPAFRRAALHFVNNWWAKSTTAPFFRVQVPTPPTGLLELHRIGNLPSLTDLPASGLANPAPALLCCTVLCSQMKPLGHKATWSIVANRDDAVPVQVEGAENLPADSEAAVYVSNHQSFLVRRCATELAGCSFAQCSRSWPQPASTWASLQRLRQLLAAEALPHMCHKGYGQVSPSGRQSHAGENRALPVLPAGYLQSVPPGPQLQVCVQDQHLLHPHRGVEHVPHRCAVSAAGGAAHLLWSLPFPQQSRHLWQSLLFRSATS